MIDLSWRKLGKPVFPNNRSAFYNQQLIQILFKSFVKAFKN